MTSLPAAPLYRPADIHAFVREEAAIAVENIAAMSKKDPPTMPLGMINQKTISAAKGLFFYHTRKVGLLVGAKWGSGFLIARLDAPGEGGPVRWTSPVFYRVQEGSIGLTAGMGRLYTLIALGTQAAINAFKVSLGEDFSMAVVTGNSDADENNIFDKEWKESVAWTCSEGLLLDASITGGAITVDTERNELLYGSGVTAGQIVDNKVSPDPPTVSNLYHFKPVYDLVESIISQADSDPRKFKGFEKYWSPQVGPCINLYEGAVCRTHTHIIQL